MATADPVLSVVVPLYNERSGLEALHAALQTAANAATKGAYELIYCDDGSSDGTAELIKQWHRADQRSKLIRLSRNFGKENALTAGIAVAHGQAILMLDGDGQHPPAALPEFLAAWRAGAQVVIGLSDNKARRGWVKRLGSRVFYRLINRLTGQGLLPSATDYRLIDRRVQAAFLELREANRITRGLIDWLGFKRAYVHFQTAARHADDPGYGRKQLVNLAVNSFVSLSPKPLYLFGYLGMVITVAAFGLGSVVFVEQLLLADPWHWHFSGTAMLAILILFLVGLLLLSQGILSLYISHIHSQAKQRPLYVIDYQESAGLDES